MTKIIINNEAEQALLYINNTNNHVFLTGKAGTGKSTFIHNLKKNGVTKPYVIVSPTGVAAINAGGVTIHSLFQLPLGVLIPGQLEMDWKFKRDKLDIIRNMKLLVIDEVASVRVDLMDAIDAKLRFIRGNNKPFGGVQLLLVGDCSQISPVTPDIEWEILKRYYKTRYFFSSYSLRATKKLKFVELTKIYRQTDPEFIKLLNVVRDGVLDQYTLDLLDSRYVPNYDPPDNCITLSTHNSKVNFINDRKLRELDSEERVYEAIVDGKFPESKFPTYEFLKLKVGAQVMFICNDRSPDKQYYNGKLGIIVGLDNELIRVKCASDNKEIIVCKNTWDNIEYSMVKGEIIKRVVGEFCQYPLKLAWSITFHKAQGLTFDQIAVDGADAFESGQVYVALSRCRTLKGITLTSRISQECVKVDPIILTYMEYARSNYT